MENLSDEDRVKIWVFDYLVHNGYSKTARAYAEALSERMRQEDEEQESQSNENVDPDSLAFTLVSDYLNKYGYENVAEKLQKEVICEKVDTELDLQTMIKSLKLRNVADTLLPNSLAFQ